MIDDVAHPTGAPRTGPADAPLPPTAERRPTPMPIDRPLPMLTPRATGQSQGAATRRVTPMAPQPAPWAPMPVEDVARGLVYSLAVVPLGMLASIVSWRLGYFPSIAFVGMLLGGAWLYTRGAGARLLRGRAALTWVMVLGIVLSCLACVGSDLWDAWAEGTGSASGESRLRFVLGHVLRPDVLASYRHDVMGPLWSMAVGGVVCGGLAVLYARWRGR